MPNRLTRHTAITAALATAAAPAAAAMPTSGDDAELLDLGRQLEAALIPLREYWKDDAAANDPYEGRSGRGS